MSDTIENTELSRKERDKKLREQDFLDAAERLFGSHGYGETSMEDVAREAQYATGTIYRYFPSKEALYNQIMLRKGQAYFQRLQERLAEAKSPFEKINSFIQTKIDFFFENKAFMNMYITQVSGHQPGTPCSPPEELQEMFGQFQRIFENILSQGINEGVFRKLDTELVRSAIFGMTNEVLHAAIAEDAHADRSEVTQFLIHFTHHGLVEKEASL